MHCGTYVPNEEMICGRCNVGATRGVKERAFFEYFADYDERLSAPYFTLRDQQAGCGVRRRPDMLIHAQSKGSKATFVTIEDSMETYKTHSVNIVIEVDETKHTTANTGSYSPICELARLQEIQGRDNDSLFVLRYHVDQEGGLTNAKLAPFCERLLEVLNGDFLEAVKAPSLIVIEYSGYPENRRQMLEKVMMDQQHHDYKPRVVADPDAGDQADELRGDDEHGPDDDDDAAQPME
jgi:hypothetical protein